MMPANQQRHLKAQQRLCDAFNAGNPIGTVCRYWTGAREGKGEIAATCTEARIFGGRVAIVWLEGVHGCVALSHVAIAPRQAVRP
jgi:hypothetical protein